MGLTSPHTESFAAARGAAYSVFDIIARKPTIDSLSEEGEKPSEFVGNMKLKDVHFKYPSRPDVKVCIFLFVCYIFAYLIFMYYLRF